MELGGGMTRSNLYPSGHDGLVAVSSLYDQGAISSDMQFLAPKRRTPGTSPTTATWQRGWRMSQFPNQLSLMHNLMHLL